MQSWAETNEGWRLDTDGGFLVLKHAEDHFVLDYLMVHPEHRRQGIATKLMRECIRRFGHHEIRLEIGSIAEEEPEEVSLEATTLPMEHEALKNFYLKYGFSPTKANDDCLRRPGRETL